MKSLKKRIERLEKHLAVKAIPREDRVQVILGSREQREAEFKRRKAEVIRKYGPQALEEIQFVEIIDNFADE
jgi:hypothetical protein